MAKRPNLKRPTQMSLDFAQFLRDCWLAGYSRRECHNSLSKHTIANTPYWHWVVDKVFDDLECRIVIVSKY